MTTLKTQYWIYKTDNPKSKISYDEWMDNVWVPKMGNLIKKKTNMEETKFKIGDKAIKTKGYEFPCTIVAVFKTIEGNVRVVGEMDGYGLLHIFNEDQLELVTNH
jgi:hypothetical protein